MNQQPERVNKDVLESRFIRKVLTEEGQSIDNAQSKLIASRRFESSKWANRSFKVTDTSYVYTHLGPHRFVDMRTRNTAVGKKRKKNHPLHNRIIFSHYNNMVKEFTFGFTASVKQQLRQIED